MRARESPKAHSERVPRARAHERESEGGGWRRAGGAHLVEVDLEPAVLGDERAGDDLDVVDLGGDAVHAVGRRADEDLVAFRPAGRAADAHQEVDHLVRPDAEVDVVGRGEPSERGEPGLERRVRGRRVAIERSRARKLAQERVGELFESEGKGFVQLAEGRSATRGG